MANFKMLVTNDGKHPAFKWAELAADEIIEISAQAPETLMREAMEFRKRLVDLLTHHHQHSMDAEQKEIKAGKDRLDRHLDTEDHADRVTEEICHLSHNMSFADHFAKDEVKQHLNAVLNRYFKSAKLVERQHHHTEKARMAEHKSDKAEKGKK